MWQEKIKIAGPYNFDLALCRLAMDPLNIVNQQERSIKVPIYGDVQEVAFVQAIGTTDEPQFLVSGQDKTTKQHVLHKIYTIFQWTVPLNEIQEHFATTNLREIFSVHRGTPIVLEFDPYTSLIRSIIHQQINMKFAISLTETFVKTFGYEIDGVPFFPLPEIVAKLAPEQLRVLKFSQRKAEYMISLAQKLASGELILENLSTLPDEEIIRELVKIRGVGPWTAQSYLLFGLGRPNLFPATDIGIQKAIKNLFELGKKPTREEMIEYSKEWEPYLSYASLYLWRSIEEE